MLREVLLIVGYFDIFIIASTTIIDVIYWKKTNNNFVFGCLNLMLFSLFFPLISIFIEVGRVQFSRGFIDNFEVVYTLLKFPLYWCLGVIQIIFLLYRNYRFQ